MKKTLTTVLSIVGIVYILYLVVLLGARHHVFTQFERYTEAHALDAPLWVMLVTLGLAMFFAIYGLFRKP